MAKPIRSDDENALELLTARAEELRKAQESMKQKNAYYRSHGTMKGYEGLTDEKADEMDNKIRKGYSFEQQPYPAWALQNNLQNLRTTEQRIKQLSREETHEAKEYDTAHLGFEVREDKEDMRLRVIFDGKPELVIREELKGRGFKWSPTNDAWQRLLNDNARYSLRRFIEFMEERHKTESKNATTVTQQENIVEQDFINSEKDMFAIYQLKNNGNLLDYHFTSFDDLARKGNSIDKNNYNFVYAAPLFNKADLDGIYDMFNRNLPADFKGHSLTTSDIIGVKHNGKLSANYVDDIGFVEMPDFFPQSQSGSAKAKSDFEM